MLIGLLGVDEGQLLMARSQRRMARVWGIGTDRFGDGVAVVGGRLATVYMGRR